MKNEIGIGNKPISLDVIDQVKKSVCKIILRNKKSFGTGFFMKYSEKKYLLTNHHVIEDENEIVEIEIWNVKKDNKTPWKIDLKDRFKKFIPDSKDITIIEIKESDDIYKDVYFLNYDTNYKNQDQGYSIYNEADIFSIEHPFGGTAKSASGKITAISGFEFDHNISTEEGSSGSPILLLHDNINFVYVIGIHKGAIRTHKQLTNLGTFIGEIFNEINEDNKESKSQKRENYIIAEIDIKKCDVNVDVRIINSYEEWRKTNQIEKNETLMNEKEINKSEIKIEDKPISFCYFYKFASEGKYKIKYSFKEDLTKTSLMFGDCELITSIDLSNFNTKNIKNMNSMFGKCSNLIDINLSNFNTENVLDMDSMFGKCSSIKKIDLSNFNTNNVTNMSGMFAGCSSLQGLDVSKFNTQNVTDIKAMFAGCSSLTSLDLSNFKTKKIVDMRAMFKDCTKLQEINLSNFEIQNETKTSSMFDGCKSLKKEKVETKDQNILKTLDELN